MTTPELEAMAQAMFEADEKMCADFTIIAETWETTKRKPAYETLARAALMAIRNVDTEAMLGAGTAVLMPYAQKLLPGSTSVAVWQAMIDHILSGE